MSPKKKITKPIKKATKKAIKKAIKPIHQKGFNYEKATNNFKNKSWRRKN